MQPCRTQMLQPKYSVKPSVPFTHDLKTHDTKDFSTNTILNESEIQETMLNAMFKRYGGVGLESTKYKTICTCDPDGQVIHQKKKKKNKL